MELLREDFSEGQPISAVGFKWFNAVGQFINRLTGKHGIKVTRFGQFPTVELDLQNSGSQTSPSATKGVSVHGGEFPELCDFYDEQDRLAHRTDPRMVFPDLQDNYDVGGNHVPPSRMTGADDVTPVGWERGKTAWKNGHNVDTEHPPVGCSMTVCTHMRRVALTESTYKYQALFSRMDFDENGLLVRVVPCTNWYTMM